MGPRRRSNATLVAAAGCLGALSALGGPWLPAQVGGGAKADIKDLPPCEAALAAGSASFENVRDAWTAAAEAGRLIPDLGSRADKAEQRALADFDRGVEEGSCASQRSALQSAVRKEAQTAFLAQRQLTEQDVGGEFADRLLGSMKKRGGPLRVQEKVDMLRDSVKSYEGKVQKLMPSWAEGQLDQSQAEAERRLGELQFTIENTQDGRILRSKWDRARVMKVMNERAHGMSLSLDPALRVMIRPEGLGNLQVFSVGPSGPPNSPVQVNVGILNDGSIADVYREHPQPPLVSVQPAVKVNLNLR